MDMIQAIRHLVQLVASKGDRDDDEALQQIMNTLEDHGVQVTE